MTGTWASADSFGGSGHGRGARSRWWPSWRRSASTGEPSLPPFTPTPVDKDAQRRWVVTHIDELPPYAIDEAHSHLLDAAIDDKADQWIAQLNREFADYVGWLRQLRGRLHATVVHRQHIQQSHDQRVAEALSARTAAANRLRGEDDEGKWHQQTLSECSHERRDDPDQRAHRHRRFRVRRHGGRARWADRRNLRPPLAGCRCNRPRGRLPRTRPGRAAHRQHGEALSRRAPASSGRACRR